MKSTWLRLLLFTFAFCALILSRALCHPLIESSFDWQTAAPESVGMESLKLSALRELQAQRHTKAFLVIRHDQIVCEWYADGYGPTRKHYTASLAKALVGGVSLMVALNDGRIGLDDHACQHIPS